MEGTSVALLFRLKPLVPADKASLGDMYLLLRVGDSVADAMRLAAVLLQDVERFVGNGGVDDVAEADPHVEDLVHFASGTLAWRWMSAKIGCGSINWSITKPTGASTRARFKRPSLVMLISAFTPCRRPRMSIASGT